MSGSQQPCERSASESVRLPADDLQVAELSRATSSKAENLHDALRLYAKQANVGMVVFKEFPSRYRGQLECLSGDGYTVLEKYLAGLDPTKKLTTNEH